MTVKRRLFISNLFMIIIPLLLTAIVGSVVMLATASILGINDTRGFRAMSDFNSAVSQVHRLSQQWESHEQFTNMDESITDFYESNARRDISIAIFQNDTALYSSGYISDESLIPILSSRPGNQSISSGGTMLYKIEAGEYTVFLEGPGTHIPFGNGRFGGRPLEIFGIGIIAFVAACIIILLTNQILTRMVFRSISNPLDLLVHGVHQLRDGNLQYRIEYTGKDEFAGICSDFNEMAGQLLDMVNARKKDDENRRELIAGISHDLRTPLTSIISYAEALEKGLAKTPDTQKRYIDTIKRKSIDLEHTVSQLFLFSKLDVGEFPLRLERLNIGDEISKFAAGVSDEYKEKGLQINIRTIPFDIYISADVVQLRNAFANILDNSLKYGRQENGVVNIDCRADGQDVIITLTDNGSGVPKAALENLFSAFYRADKARSNPGQSSGLGLAITAKILQQLGGSIMAKNADEGGLSIIMKFPTIL